MNPNTALLGALGAGLAGAAASAAVSRWRAAAGWTAFAATALSSAFALAAAGTVLASGKPAPPLELLAVPALGSSLRFQIDGLSAFFLGLIAVLALLSALFSVRYLDHYRELGVGRYYPHVLLFVAGMYGIVTTTDLMLFFCVFWQMMTIPSYLLVRFERTEANVRAANRYLLMMEVSCVLVMAGAALLGSGAAPSGHAAHLARYDFDRLGAALPGLLAGRGGLVGAALLLFLAGFGIKAGMWPFGQLWLPAAHPAAPSPVSALLSGVMIKTGVYGLMRTFFWLVPAASLGAFPAEGWGALLAALGTLTLFIGTVQALKQEQTKRLLAFSSIGQVGYIILGLGICLTLAAAGKGRPAVLALAAVGFAGALFHTINHALFKSLLFLNAGSMLHAAGTQDLSRLGGLMRFMPLTGITALVASLSIAGIPPFNGFASKWHLYVSAFAAGPGAMGAFPSLRILPVCGLLAVATSALTLASFMKFFGTSFLSRPSAPVLDRAKGGPLEAPAAMQIPQILLAITCLLFGLLPFLGTGLVRGALDAGPMGFGTLLAGAGASEVGGRAILAPLVLAAVLGAFLLLAWWIGGLGGSTRREAEPWLCGHVRDAEAYRYRAHGWYGEIKRGLEWVGGRPPEERDGP